MKTLKATLLLVCMILCGMTSLFSQDVIFLSNGNEIEAKVIKIGDSEIEYKRYNYQDGPTYTEKVSNIFMIKYQNGEKDVFNTIKEQHKTMIKKDNKILLGLNVGLGCGTVSANKDSGLGFASTLGLDVVFPIGKIFALGPYTSIGYDTYAFETSFGALTMFRFENNAAIIIGGGANLIWTGHGSNAWGKSIRFGGKFPNRMYLFGEIATSSLEYGYQYVEIFDMGSYNYYQYNTAYGTLSTITFSIHLGFRIN